MQKGFSLIEVILATALFALFVAALVGMYLYGQESTMLAGNRVRASLLAEEGLEAVRNIRDEGSEGSFDALTAGTYGLATSSNQWVLSGSSDTTDIFTRSITITDVGADRKDITSTITWQQNPQRSGTLSLVTRLTDWLGTIASIGDWSNPFQEASLDLPGNNDGLKVQISGDYAYVVRSGGGSDFTVVDISNSASSTVASSLNLAGTLSNIFVSGDYAYVTSNANSSELIIVDISTPSVPSVIGSLNNPGNQNAQGVYVVGTTAYVVFDGNDEFSIVDVSSPSAPSLLGTLNLTNRANDIVVSGNYAYIVSDDNSEELQVVDISSPASPLQTGSLNLPGNTDADTISIAGTNLYIGQGSDFRSVSIAAPLTPSFSGSFNASGIINDIALQLGNNNTYAYIATSDNSLEFQVIDVSVPTSPMLIGSFDVASNNDLRGIAYDETHDRAVGVSNSNTEEVLIFAPQ